MAASTGLTWVLHTDLVNVSRGRGVVGYDPLLRPPPTVGWVPADLGLDAFGALAATPWGPIGDLRLVPDPATFVEIESDPDRLPPFRFVLADCTGSDGVTWPACPRGVLRRAVELLEAEFGLQLRVGVEHEFAIAGLDGRLPFSVDAARSAEPLLSAIVDALTGAGLDPEYVLPEFGVNQFEVTIEPTTGVTAADRAVMTREVIREVARARGEHLSFAPVIGIGAGTNGAHLHLSLLDGNGDREGHQVSEAPGRPLGLSDRARGFAAGILDHLPALTALTAPSVASYMRLQPRSWSAAYRAIGISNREAAIRVSPGRPGGAGRQRLGPSMELRTSDATANPYLALAGVVTAGIDGLRRGLDVETVVDRDPADLGAEERAARGVDDLPRSLDQALDALHADQQLVAMLGPELAACWFSVKRNEAERFRSAAPSEIVEAYSRAY